MGFFNAFAWFIAAAVLMLAALAQGIVALFEFLRRGHNPRILVLFMVVSLLLAGLAGYGAVQQSAHSISAAQPSPSAQASGNQAPSPTDMVPPTDTPLPTANIQPTDTPLPTLPPTPGPASKAATTLPFLMNCECASNPVQVRVTAVDIQQSLGRMIWSLTVLNVGTEKLNPTFRQIALDLNGQLSDAEGGMVDTPVSLAPNGQSGDTAQSTLTFTFVPEQGTYTLKAIMDLCQGICDSVFYSGQPFSFQ